MDSDAIALKVWNIDDTGVRTIQKPTKILATKGPVGKITSGERGQIVTVMCCMKASWIYPAYVLLQWKCTVQSLSNDSPLGSFSICTSS